MMVPSGFCVLCGAPDGNTHNCEFSVRCELGEVDEIFDTMTKAGCRKRGLVVNVADAAWGLMIAGYEGLSVKFTNRVPKGFTEVVWTRGAAKVVPYGEDG